MSQLPLEKPRTGLVIWMIVSQILALLSLIIWLLVAGLSVMAFDSGVSAEAWTFVIVVWSYPLIPLVLVIGSWIAFARHRNRLAAVLSGLSFAPPVLFYLCIAISSFSWHIMNRGF
ncbi:MAG TPA: hypothetical protein VHO49_16745 [Anaerolineales bacterium]|nr:hypothetical protein [Anaerolineales bacterium]